MTFIELLLAAKGGSKPAFEKLFGRYKIFCGNTL